MTDVIETAVSASRAVLRLFIDDGVYAAMTIAWITAIVTLGPYGVTSQTSTIAAPGSHSVNGQTLGVLLLALGLDLIFAVSVALRVQSAIRSRSSKA